MTGPVLVVMAFVSAADEPASAVAVLGASVPVASEVLSSSVGEPVFGKGVG